MGFHGTFSSRGSKGQRGTDGATGSPGADGATGAAGPSGYGTLVASLSAPLAVLGSVTGQVVHTIAVASTTKKTYHIVASGYFTSELGTNEGFWHDFGHNVYRSGGGTINVAAATVIVNREQYAGVSTRLVGGASLTVVVDSPTLTPTTWTRLDVYEV